MSFEIGMVDHDTALPVDGYAAPQLHTHAVIFKVTERDNGQTRALLPQEPFTSQRVATSIYRSELAMRFARLGRNTWDTANMETLAFLGDVGHGDTSGRRSWGVQ